MIHLEHECPKLFEVWEYELATPEELHAALAADFGFPSHYGANLAALSDCLGDVDEPWAIIVSRCSGAGRREWFDGFCSVFERAAAENPALEFHYDEPDAQRVSMPERPALPPLDQVVAHLERIDRRLDAIQDAMARPEEPRVSPAMSAPKAAGETCRNMASGSDGDRFECGSCGCRVSDYLEDTRQLIDGLKFCPNCGREVTNPAGNNALGWVGELI